MKRGVIPGTASEQAESICGDYDREKIPGASAANHRVEHDAGNVAEEVCLFHFSDAFERANEVAPEISP